MTKEAQLLKPKGGPAFLFLFLFLRRSAEKAKCSLHDHPHELPLGRGKGESLGADVVLTCDRYFTTLSVKEGEGLT